MSEEAAAPPGSRIPTATAASRGTGHAGVDAALARLGDLDQAPLAEHAAIVEDVHERLRAALAAQVPEPEGPAAVAPAPEPFPPVTEGPR